MYANVAARRWYHPTPTWLVYGAAVATSVLYAVERWRWFPVHYQKGWPVLLAVAIAAAVLVLIMAWMLVALVFRRRVQFGLRTMLVFVTLCAVVCSWLAVRITQARRQADAVAAIWEKYEGHWSYDWEFDESGQRKSNALPPAPEPLTKLLGMDFFADVEMLFLYTPPRNDVALIDPAVTTQVKRLIINGDELTDAWSLRLGSWTNLRYLELFDPNVSLDDVKKLRHSLPKCEIKVVGGFGKQS